MSGEMTSVEVVPAVNAAFTHSQPPAPPPYAQAGDVTDPSSPPPSYEEIFNKNDGASGADTGVRSSVWTVEEARPAPVLAPVATPPPQGRTDAQRGNSVLSNTRNPSSTRPRIPFTCCPGTKKEREARIQKTCIGVYGILIPVCQLIVVAIHGLDSCWLEGSEFLPEHQLVAGLTSPVIWGLITVRIFYMERLSTDRAYIESKPTNAQGMVRMLFFPAGIFLMAWTGYGFVLVFGNAFGSFYFPDEPETTTTTTTPSWMDGVTSSTTMRSTTNTTPDPTYCSEEVLLVAFCAAVVQLVPIAVFVLYLLGRCLVHVFSCKPK